MFQKKADMRTGSEPDGHGGEMHFRHLPAEAISGWASMGAVVTMKPGDTVETHTHVDDGDLYMMLSGRLQITEDGVTQELFPGDVEYCAPGHSHGVFNHTEEPASFLALVVRKP